MSEPTQEMKARALVELIREAFIGVALTRSAVRLLQSEIYEESLKALSEAFAAGEKRGAEAERERIAQWHEARARECDAIAAVNKGNALGDHSAMHAADFGYRAMLSIAPQPQGDR